MSCTRKRSLSQIYSLANPDVVSEETGPKSGKWSAEEEMFANKLIAQFEAGTLTDCAEGSTLRSYLARKLNCAPMRISKKFAGQCIGKHTFTKKELCVTPATDRDSLSEASTLTSSPAALHDDSLDFMPGKVVNIMSFDTFTEFQGRQDLFTSSSNYAPARAAVTFPVPERGRAGMNIWSNSNDTPQSHVYPPQKRQLVTAFADSAFESPCRAGDVGLDLDNMYASSNAAKVTPMEYARMTPPPGPAAELPMKKDWGLKCTIPQYQFRPQSPSKVVPSGAAVVTPCHAVAVAAGTSSSPALCQPVPLSAFTPCSCPPLQQPSEQCKQFEACPQYDFCDAADLEAAEWRDVLDYFCGPQALYC